MGESSSFKRRGSKRQLLVDGRGIPLSLVVTGASRHGVSQLEPKFAALGSYNEHQARPTAAANIWVPMRATPERLLCETIEDDDYIAHVKVHGREANELKRHLEKKAKRWVAEVTHS